MSEPERIDRIPFGGNKRHGLRVVVAALIMTASLMLAAGCGDENERGAVLYTAERSPAIAEARVGIALPADGQVLAGDGGVSPEIEGASGELRSVSVELEVSGFELGAQTRAPRAGRIANSQNGQHVHLIVDNRPYVAVYDTEDVALALPPGPHTLFAFPGRSYHESVKTPGAAVLVNFYVGEASGEFSLEADAPAIIYSRPKGTYSGADARDIMLDFYLSNVELGPGGYTARYTIVGKEDPGRRYTIDVNEWVPAFASGLESGTYSVTLELLDGDGEPVPGEWNRTTREIVVVTGEGGS